MYIPRTIEPLIENHLFKGKIILISGARQVGKTTLVKKLARKAADTYLYLNCDESDIKQRLDSATTSTQLKMVIGNYKLVLIDEAQRIKDIGLKLKLLVDTFPGQQIIATGSSSLDLANKTQEALTGRNYEFLLYPLSLPELRQELGELEIARQLETFLIYGLYPDVYRQPTLPEKMETIKTLTQNYLYKDIVTISEQKKSETLTKLLQALALQIGNEVSYNELANLVGVSKQLIAKYIELLEKVYIIFKLPPFSRNLRKELSKNRKIYFYDTGIRNAIINQFNSLSLRDDAGRLWENFVIAQRMKKDLSIGTTINRYFWRTYDQQEIDLIEEQKGVLHAFEIKWTSDKVKIPISWKNAYPQALWQVINRENINQTG